MKLYDYPRSSASYRVRIALHLKGIDFERIPVDLLGSEQHADAYRALNPQQLVPSLIDGGPVLTQSLAILEYLDETHPEPPLLPAEPAARARVRALAEVVACDVHPLQNLRVRRYLEDALGQPEAEVLAWNRHWIASGLEAFESLLTLMPESGPYCAGEHVSLADVCLVPQIFNARRYECPLDPHPTIVQIAAACEQHPAFLAAHPDAPGADR